MHVEDVHIYTFILTAVDDQMLTICTSRSASSETLCFSDEEYEFSPICQEDGSPSETLSDDGYYDDIIVSLH